MTMKKVDLPIGLDVVIEPNWKKRKKEIVVEVCSSNLLTAGRILEWGAVSQSLQTCPTRAPKCPQC